MIRWHRSREGFVTSRCGEFTISPLYWGRVGGQEYELRFVRRGRRATRETQRLCKALATSWWRAHVAEQS